MLPGSERTRRPPNGASAGSGEPTGCFLKYSLPFTLLADPDHRSAEDYGVWVERNMYGKNCMGINRSTFVIDAGNVARALYGVKPADHADQVFEALPG